MGLVYLAILIWCCGTTFLHYVIVLCCGHCLSSYRVISIYASLVVCDDIVYDIQ